jgi:hypothetical protein
MKNFLSLNEFISKLDFILVVMILVELVMVLNDISNYVKSQPLFL